MKILIFNKNLKGTGAPRVLLSLAELLNKHGHDVSFVIDDDTRIDFEVPESLRLLKLGFGGVKRIDARAHRLQKDNVDVSRIDKMRLRILAKLHSVSNKLKHLKIRMFPNSTRKSLVNIDPDICLYNNMTDTFYVADIAKSVCPLILCVHMDPEAIFNGLRSNHNRAKFRSLLEENQTVCVSKNAATHLRRLFPKALKVDFVYNHLERSWIEGLQNEKSITEFEEFFLYVGGLIQRKRVDRILYAYAKTNRRRPLLIVGQGSQEVALKNLARDLGIENLVHFMGFVENPYPLIARATALLLTSEAEGLPTVILEAFILQTPVISVDCPTGPSELLTGDFEEFLIPNEDNEELLINRISNAMQTIHERDLNLEFMRVTDEFDGESIANMWQKIFEITLKSCGPK